MTTLSNISHSLREINRIVTDELRLLWESDEQPRTCYVLRRDGDTTKYDIDRYGRITRTKIAGHVTCGMWVDPCDLPCIVSR